MPFELGLTVAWGLLGSPEHTWFVCEQVKRRINKSLSDLDGTEAYIHDGTIEGVFRELCNAFVRTERQPSVDTMRAIYRDLRKSFKGVLQQAGATDPFSARVFQDLSVVASASADQHI